MQACCFKQHAMSTVHRAAQEAYLRPEAPLSECLPYTLEDQKLFGGNVPQPLEWLRAWRACRTPSAFRAALAHFQTEDFAQGRRSKVQPTGPALLVQSTWFF